jgi:hypothetical protein
MKSNVIALFSALLLFQSVSAAVLEVTPGTVKMNGVTLNTAAKTKIEGKDVALEATGAGLRTKTIAKVKVYVGQLYVSNSAKFYDKNLVPLESLDFQDMQAVALQMSMLHEVTAEKLNESFIDGFKANKIDYTQKPAADFLAAVLKAGEIEVADGSKTLTVIGRRLSDGSEEIVWENSETGLIEVVSGGKGFIKTVFSIWLGEPADGGLKTLKKGLIGEKK